MGDFRYADPGDALTAQLIANEYDERYWAESELKVLCKADGFMLRRLGRERMEAGKLLDAGCGTGRLIPRFSKHFGHVFAFDPDETRAGQAADLVAQSGIGNATVSCGYSGEYRAARIAGANFDAILSSHVIQHIPHSAALAMLRDLRMLIADDGVLVLTTTFAHGDASTYALERADESGHRVETPTDAAGFDAAMNTPGILPVCRFARPHAERLLREAGFDVIGTGCFHFANEHKASNDDFNSVDPNRLPDARDAYYLCAPLPVEDEADTDLVASGKVCYMQYYALDERAITGHTLQRAELLANDAGSDADVMHEFEVVEGFLYGGGLHFPTRRFAFDGRVMRHRDIPFEDSFVVVSLYPETGVCQISVCFTFGQTTVDDLVYLHQIQHNANALFDVTATDEIVALRTKRKASKEWVGTLPEECSVSIQGLCQQILEDLRLTPIASTSAFIMELNEYGDADTPDDLNGQQRLALYGILTGDEGWRHVPAAHVEDRLANSWGTRSFVKAIVFSNNCVLLNFNRGEAAAAYLDGQYASGDLYYGGVNEYFTQDAHTAGVNHGIFFSMETGMVAKAIATRLLTERPRDMNGRVGFLSGGLNRSKRYRTELISTLARIESVNVAEIGELDALVMKSLSVEERVASIRELLELVESELDLSYETNTNRMVNFLTVLGLLFAIVQVILAIPGIAG